MSKERSVAEHEPDGINGALEGPLRVAAVTAAGLAAERLVREREQTLRDAEAHIDLTACA